jgi:hypothetical protein
VDEMGGVGGLSSRVICGFETRLRCRAVEEFGRPRLPHKQEIAGFESCPRYQSRVVQRQDAGPLIQLSRFESWRESEGGGCGFESRRYRVPA